MQFLDIASHKFLFFSFISLGLSRSLYLFVWEGEFSTDGMGKGGVSTQKFPYLTAFFSMHDH